MANYNGVCKTVGGFYPTDTELTYFITVKEIEKTFQEKLNDLISENNRRASNPDNNGSGMRVLPNIKLELKGVKLSRNARNQFTVLTLILPIDVVNNRKKKQQNPEEESEYFNVAESDGQRLEIYPPIYNMFKQFMFSKDDLQSLKNRDKQRELGIDPRLKDVDTIRFIQSYGSFRYKYDKNGNPTVVVVNLNAYTVIRKLLAMVSADGKLDNRPYDVIITSVTPIAGMNYKFEAKRCIREASFSDMKTEADFIASLSGVKYRKDNDNDD